MDENKDGLHRERHNNAMVVEVVVVVVVAAFFVCAVCVVVRCCWIIIIIIIILILLILTTRIHRIRTRVDALVLVVSDVPRGQFQTEGQDTQIQREDIHNQHTHPHRATTPTKVGRPIPISLGESCPLVMRRPSRRPSTRTSAAIASASVAVAGSGTSTGTHRIGMHPAGRRRRNVATLLGRNKEYIRKASRSGNWSSLSKALHFSLFPYNVLLASSS